MVYKYTANSSEETVKLGEKIGKKLKGGDIIAYRGGLGAGKTTLTRGISIGMGLGDNVTSPTFAIVNEYGGRLPLIHFDMYRISGAFELESTGFYDYLSDGAVLAVEWSENIADALPESRTVIEIEVTGEESREIKIYGDERFANI